MAFNTHACMIFACLSAFFAGVFDKFFRHAVLAFLHHSFSVLYLRVQLWFCKEASATGPVFNQYWSERLLICLPAGLIGGSVRLCLLACFIAWLLACLFACLTAAVCCVLHGAAIQPIAPGSLFGSSVFSCLLACLPVGILDCLRACLLDYLLACLSVCLLARLLAWLLLSLFAPRGRISINSFWYACLHNCLRVDLLVCLLLCSHVDNRLCHLTGRP